MLRIYTLKTCDSCRKATKWLSQNHISYTEIPIRENPPTHLELSQALDTLGGDIRKLFNTSGQDYRNLNIKEKLSYLTIPQTLDLLASNPNLIKRPFLISKNTTLVAFNPSTWQQALA